MPSALGCFRSSLVRQVWGLVGCFWHRRDGKAALEVAPIYSAQALQERTMKVSKDRLGMLWSYLCSLGPRG